MKIRNGFVSNSSSSSFVVLGARIAKPENVDEKVWEDLECGSPKYKINVLYHETQGGVEYVVGQVLADVSSECGGCLEDKDYPLKTLTTQAKSIKKYVKDILGLDITPSLIMGTRPS